ncbi:hypothetical protein ACFQV2_08055 [Actinokineospora soli]|uniref:Uncharacterized protein n=1 Tax=Actinokineospora soli TaxID=1048753 RepID=A0ABW2TL54_9PSEU
MSRAHSLLAVGLTALGRPAEAVDPGVAALRSAVSAGRVDEAMTLRTALAACARALGDPLAGSEILRPAVTGAGTTDLSPLVAARALAELAACLSHLASRDDVEDALTEADRLLAADEALPPRTAGSSAPRSARTPPRTTGATATRSPPPRPPTRAWPSCASPTAPNWTSPPSRPPSSTN